jgi:mono/diheme cytochrome c family protein
MRQPVAGTIPRGFLRSDSVLFTGKKEKSAQSTPSPSPASGNTNPYTDDTDTFPFPISEQTVMRGRERYDIFCSVCHGLTGHGDGMIVRRGFRQAANFHDDRLRKAPVGHFFDAITNGWGAMPSYAAQIPAQDRWAIIAYVRALQLAQQKSPQTATPPSGGPTPTPQLGATSGGHE